MKKIIILISVLLIGNICYGYNVNAIQNISLIDSPVYIINDANLEIALENMTPTDIFRVGYYDGEVGFINWADSQVDINSVSCYRLMLKTFNYLSSVSTVKNKPNESNSYYTSICANVQINFIMHIIFNAKSYTKIYYFEVK